MGARTEIEFKIKALHWRWNAIRCLAQRNKPKEKENGKDEMDADEEDVPQVMDIADIEKEFALQNDNEKIKEDEPEVIMIETNANGNEDTHTEKKDEEPEIVVDQVEEQKNENNDE